MTRENSALDDLPKEELSSADLTPDDWGIIERALKDRRIGGMSRTTRFFITWAMAVWALLGSLALVGGGVAAWQIQSRNSTAPKHVTLYVCHPGWIAGNGQRIGVNCGTETFTLQNK